MKHVPRVPYRDAATAQREVLARACALGAELNTKDWRALAAVVTWTATYSRVEDRLTHPVLNEVAQLHPRDLAKSLNKLARLGLIEYVPGRGMRYSVIGLLTRAATPGLEAEANPGDSKAVQAPNPDAIAGLNPGVAARDDPGDTARVPYPSRTTEKDSEKDRLGKNPNATVLAHGRADPLFDDDDLSPFDGDLYDDEPDDLVAELDPARRPAAAASKQHVEVDEDGGWQWLTEAEPGEAGILADCEALVAAGVARWVDDGP